MKPKILFRYNKRFLLEKHYVGVSCHPQVVAILKHGTLWRCLHEGTGEREFLAHDYSGYVQKKEAQAECRIHIIAEISKLRDLYKKIKRSNDSVAINTNDSGVKHCASR